MLETVFRSEEVVVSCFTGCGDRYVLEDRRVGDFDFEPYSCWRSPLGSGDGSVLARLSSVHWPRTTSYAPSKLMISRITNTSSRFTKAQAYEGTGASLLEVDRAACGSSTEVA